jgi:hypothetical protein
MAKPGSWPGQLVYRAIPVVKVLQVQLESLDLLVVKETLGEQQVLLDLD